MILPLPHIPIMIITIQRFARETCDDPASTPIPIMIITIQGFAGETCDDPASTPIPIMIADDGSVTKKTDN